METNPSLGQSRLVSDAHGRLLFQEYDFGGISAANKCRFVYVDNLALMSLDAASTSQVLGEVTTNFDRVCLKTHEK